LLVRHTWAQNYIALGVAIVEPDPAPLDEFATSSWLQASHVYVNMQACGFKGKGKTFGIPILTVISSVKGLMLCMDQGTGQGPPGFPSTMLQEFGCIEGESYASASTMMQRKGQGSDNSIMNSSDMIVGQVKGKALVRGKGKQPTSLDEGVPPFLEAPGRGKGEDCDADIIVDMDESHQAYLEATRMLSTDVDKTSAIDQASSQSQHTHLVLLNTTVAELPAGHHGLM
jgi:hypothetical protein